MILATIISVEPNHLENKNCPDRFLHLCGCQAASKFPSNPPCVTRYRGCHASALRVCVCEGARESMLPHIGLRIAIIFIFKHRRARK